MPEIGEKAPDISLPTDTEGEFSLAASADAVVLFFYPRDDTSGCTREAREFTAAAAKFAALGVRLVGVSKDTVASHAKFRAKHDLGVTLASDADGDVCETYGVWVEKKMYGRSFMGIERATFLIGADGTIANIWRKVKVPGHVEAVLEAARAL